MKVEIKYKRDFKHLPPLVVNIFTKNKQIIIRLWNWKITKDVIYANEK